jgi:hypothetical protein
VLARVEPGGVDRDEADVVGEQRPGARREVLEPGAHGNHHVALGSQLVGARRAHDADRADVHRVLVDEHGPPGYGLTDGDAVPLGEARQRVLRPAVAHATAGDDQRLPGRLEQLHGGPKLVEVGPRARDAMDDRLEEPDRVVERLTLHVLAQPQEGRAAVRRVEHRRHRLRQRLEDLLGPRDPVPVAGDRPEGVVDADRRVAEVLDLLEHRVRRAGDVVVAREQQHRQPVGVRHARGRDHVGGARPDRAGRHHDLPALPGLRERDRRQRHRLLVLPAPGRQLVLDASSASERQVTLPCRRSRTRRGTAAPRPVIEQGALGHQVADERLGHGQADGLHGGLPGACWGWV